MTTILALLASTWLYNSSPLAMPMVGDRAPGFITPALSGQNVSLRDFWEKDGRRLIVLTFFATYCDSCRNDLVYLQGIQERLETYGVQVVGLLTQDPAGQEEIARYTSEVGMKFPVLLDEMGIIGARYGVAMPPVHFVIVKGTVRGFYLGLEGERRRDFEALLREILDLPAEVVFPREPDLFPP